MRFDTLIFETRKLLLLLLLLLLITCPIGQHDLRGTQDSEDQSIEVESVGGGGCLWEQEGVCGRMEGVLPAVLTSVAVNSGDQTQLVF